jgi:hypothetical protein
MSRKYQPVEYSPTFQGSAQSAPFDPQRAFDNSAAIKARAAAKIADIQTMAASSARQYQLEQSILQAEAGVAQRGIQAKGLAKGLKLASKAGDLKQQAFEENSQLAMEGAVKSGQMQADQAQSAVTFKVLQGLMQLAPTMMGAYQEIQQIKAQRADEDQLLQSIGWGEVPLELSPIAKVEETQQQTAIASEARAISEVAREQLQNPTVENQSIAHVLQQSSTYNQTKAATANSYDAAASHSIFIAEALRNLPPEQTPKTAAEAQVLLRDLNRQFLRSTGMMSADRGSMLRVARVMYGNTTNFVSNLVTSAIKKTEENNLIATQGLISNLVEDKAASPEEIWKVASSAYANGNVGYVGFSGASNKAALENVLQEAAVDGNTALINQLRDVQQVPGQAGTELGKMYDNIFDKYESASRKQLIENYNLDQTERSHQTQQSIQFFLDAPTPENRQKAVAILREIGTEDALKEADRLAANGLSYDPQKKFELMELQQQGVDIPEDVLQQLLTDGTISAAEFKQFSKGAPEKTALKAVDDHIKAISGGLKTSMQGQAGPQDLTAEVKAELTIRHQMMVEDLRRRVAAEVKSNPDIATDPVELSRVIEAQTKYLMGQPQYTLTADPKTGYRFAGEITADQRLARITVSPGVQDFTKFAPEQVFGKALKIPRSEMDATKDRFLTVNDLRADVKRVLEGKDPSNRTRLYARNLGLSSTAFLEGQLGVNGLPSLGTLRQGPDAMKLLNSLRDIPSASEGMKVLRSMGFPSKGAAYLAGNIQQESGWHGLRRWGEVAGDGSDRNGGLISWMDDAERNHYRLRQVERHYGKSIDKISESDQLAYMVIEMKKRNPSAYRVFMNPNATEGELQRASYQYWGYGHEGGRFTYARNLLAQGRL